jgi:hypothetical protein
MQIITEEKAPNYVGALVVASLAAIRIIAQAKSNCLHIQIAK